MAESCPHDKCFHIFKPLPSGILNDGSVWVLHLLFKVRENKVLIIVFFTQVESPTLNSWATDIDIAPITEGGDVKVVEAAPIPQQHSVVMPMPPRRV